MELASSLEKFRTFVDRIAFRIYGDSSFDWDWERFVQESYEDTSQLANLIAYLSSDYQKHRDIPRHKDNVARLFSDLSGLVLTGILRTSCSLASSKGYLFVGVCSRYKYLFLVSRILFS